jgi:hypothetical protein
LTWKGQKQKEEHERVRSQKPKEESFQKIDSAAKTQTQYELKSIH